MTSSRVSIWARLTLLAAAAVGLQACAPTGYYSGADGYYSGSDAYYAPDAGYYGNYYGDYRGDSYAGYTGDYDDYWYYPAVGAYYDPRVSIYYYYEHNTWITARELPRHYRPHLGRHVVVRSPHDRPYAEHHRHRDRHAPDRYREARYDRPDRQDDVWIGAPRRDRPERDRHDVRDDRNDRADRKDRNYRNERNERNDNGNGNYQSRERAREHRTADVQPRAPEPVRAIRREDRRERDREADARTGHAQERRIAAQEPRQRERKPMTEAAPRVRSQDMPRVERDRRGPSAEVTPVRQQTQAPPRRHGNEKVQQEKRADDERRGNARKRGDAESRQSARAAAEDPDHAQ